ncbi:MAG TPA: type VI secretion system baseplate subunit TssF [Candidatus Dormibacteraeota bacterium]|nr:type VI secretion system baseplate subunit TssF [Candidatus Dormibacteraeota bacterium]
MRNELRDYYESELTFLRQIGAEFADKYPKIASRLLLETDRCEDPHVERMLEAFALLAARVHLRIDDDFPQITAALLNILYPHYLRPVPSMTVAQFHTDPESGKLTSALKIPKGTVLYSRPVEGVPCKFRTSYDTTLWPFKVSQAQWMTPDRIRPALRASEAAVLRVELECFQDVSFEKLELDTLGFYLNGESSVVHALYELLCRNCVRILVRDPAKPKSPVRELSVRNLQPVGFGENEDVLPYPRRSFMGYRLLQEYFAFPEKFFFMNLKGLSELQRAGFTSKAELLFMISPFEQDGRHQRLEVAVNDKTLRLGCTPIINLFSQAAEPILVDQTRYQYPIVPDARRRQTMEIYSVDEVVSTDAETHQTIAYHPLYSERHVVQGTSPAYWYITRSVSNRKGDEGTDVFLSLVDLSARPMQLDYDTVTVRCTCTNRDLVTRLPFGSEAGDFEMTGAAAIKRIVALHKPTRTLRPPLDGKTLWSLISHLSLNYLSIVDDGKEALQKILELYDFSDSADIKKQISGIATVSSRRHFTRVASEHGVGFARGTRVEIEFDEEQFSGSGAYLFASVLEKFFGLYTSMNSFTQLVARSRQRKEALEEWAPRAGQSILI